jgi:hypothetical protein
MTIGILTGDKLGSFHMLSKIALGPQVYTPR